MSPTWDEYLPAMSEFLGAVGKATQLGTGTQLIAPARPTDPIPDEFRIEAARLHVVCDEVTAQVIARMEVIANRPLAMRPSPHKEQPMASYLDTEI